jgi:hypothetical protein
MSKTGAKRWGWISGRNKSFIYFTRLQKSYPLAPFTSCNVLDVNSFHGTGCNAVPAVHAHVLKNNGWLKRAIDLFHHFVGTGDRRRANPLFGVAILRMTFIIIQHGKGFFRLHVYFLIVIGD